MDEVFAREDVHVVFVAAGVLDQGHPFAEAVEWEDGEGGKEEGKEGEEDRAGGETHVGSQGKVAGGEWKSREVGKGMMADSGS